MSLIEVREVSKHVELPDGADVGATLVAEGLAGVWFDNQRHLPTQLNGATAWPHSTEHPVLQAATQQLQQYFAGTRTHFELPLDTSGGTAFQQMVWQALLGLAHGSVTT